MFLLTIAYAAFLHAMLEYIEGLAFDNLPLRVESQQRPHRSPRNLAITAGRLAECN